jgi:uncharacterized protein YutE (UPF0331/DUF86 family)
MIIWTTSWLLPDCNPCDDAGFSANFKAWLAQQGAAFIREATRGSEADKFRNVLSHGYDLVDPAIVWSAVQDDLAPLLKDVEALLATVG